MKDLKMLVWLTQLGLSAVLPLACFVLLGVWLHSSLGWGQWAIWCGLVLGILCGASGLRDSLRAMNRMAGGEKAPPPPPIAYNDHD